MGITFISSNIVTITDLSGNLFNPMVALFIPLICKYSWNSLNNRKISWLWKIHDIF